MKPLFGILVSHLVVRHQPYYEKLKEAIIQSGATPLFFTPKDIQADGTTSGISTQKKKTDIKWAIPLVGVNRMASRSGEQRFLKSDAYEKFFKEKRLYFNREFFDKQRVCALLAADKVLQPYTLPFQTAATIRDVDDFLSTYRAGYLKKSKGSQGGGILRIEKVREDLYQVDSSKRKCTVSNLQAVFRKYPVFLSSEYFIQAECVVPYIEGRKWDYRVLVQKVAGKFDVTGIGIRMASEKGIVTHTLHGGEVKKYKEFPFKLSSKFIKTIIPEVGACLEKEFGFVGEFSMDIGLNEDHIPQIYEVNTKPMIFDELDIQEQSTKRLVDVLWENYRNSTIKT